MGGENTDWTGPSFCPPAPSNLYEVNQAATPGISQRLAALSESATMAITAKANALRAAGRSVIGFGAGEPDFATPAHIVEAAIAACSDARNHRYTPAIGLPELRDAVVAKTAEHSGFVVERSNVVISNGGKGALFAAFAALLDPGDEVLLPSPYWVTYPEAIALFGEDLGVDVHQTNDLYAIGQLVGPDVEPPGGHAAAADHEAFFAGHRWRFLSFYPFGEF